MMRCHTCGLGSSAFARHYLRNHSYFLFLWVLRCFSSPRSPTLQACDAVEPHRVAPFGNLRIKSYLPIPAAFRSLSRPSSPPRAKASSICPSLLSFYRCSLSYSLFEFCSFLFVCFQYVNDLFLFVVPGRFELPTSTLSV